MSREEDIENLLKPAVLDLGYIWWGVEYHHNSVNSILRIFVDKQGGGISIDEIVEITEALNPILDVENPIENAYTFEVSSPGLDRPLFNLEQYKLYLGQKIKLNTKTAIEGQRKFSGVLKEVLENSIVLEFPKAKEIKQLTIDFLNIDKCRLEPEF